MAVLLALSVGGVLFTYVLHPLVLWTLARLRPRPWSPADTELSVGVFVAAFNEEKALPVKIPNLQAQDYDGEYVIAIASDGSTDATVEIAEGFAADDPRIRVFAFRENRGKSAMQNDVVPRLGTDVVVFSDATSMWAPDTLRRIARHFADPEVGAVGVDLVFVEQRGGSVERGQGAYWRYERFLRHQAALAGTTVVVSGTCYAMRRDLFRTLPLEVAEDLVNPLRVTEAGRRVVFDPDIEVEEWSNEDHASEVRMRLRVALQNVAGLFTFWRHLDPRRGLAAYELFAHKYMRGVCWLLLVLAFLSNVALAGQSPFDWLLGAQVAFYAAAFLGWLAERRGASPGVMFVPYYFCLLNFTYAVALVRYFLGDRRPTWETVR